MNDLLQKLLDAGILTKCDENSEAIEVEFKGRMTLFSEETQFKSEQIYQLLRIRLDAHFDHACDKVMNPEDK